MIRDFEHDPLKTVEFPVMTAVKSIFLQRVNKPLTMEMLIYLVQDSCKHNHGYTEDELSKVRLVVQDLLTKKLLEDASLAMVRVADSYWQGLKMENEFFSRVVPYWQEVTEWRKEDEQ